ncbi:uncharacterized protein [Dermacentor albipictus]|uniref:uncharacterized protein isoform X2 n=1 Tax=Dermacentor albipictus TaxID=60249 RepID=UPI0038FD0E6A
MRSLLPNRSSLPEHIILPSFHRASNSISPLSVYISMYMPLAGRNFSSDYAMGARWNSLQDPAKHPQTVTQIHVGRSTVSVTITSS